MRRALFYFVQGLVIVAPVALVTWLLGGILLAVDRWVRSYLLAGGGIWGMGFLVAVALITLIGFLGSHFVTRGMREAFRSLLERVPLVKMLYGALRDLMNAFVGSERKFSRPVVVDLHGKGVRALGFMTRDSLAHLGLTEEVAVYFPQAYNFAGQVLIVPRTAVTPLNTPSAEVMTFIVSGGVSGK
jgi:uncharacterized membrane protein